MLRVAFVRRASSSLLAAFALVMAWQVDGFAQDGHTHPPRSGGGELRQTILGPPPVRFEPASLDLGTLKPGDRSDGVVMIHNVSDKWLTIKESRSSCACTAINLANTTIAPGQAVPLDISYTANATMGPKENAVRILFDGYDIAEVPVHSFVGFTVRSEPTYIDALKKRDGTQALTGEITVYAMDQRPFRVLAVNGKPPQFVNFDPESDALVNSYVIRWDVSGYDWQNGCKNAEGERMPGSLIIETDHPDAPIFDLEIRHECNRRKPAQPMDSWAASDKRLLLGAVKPGEAVEVETTLKWLPRREQNHPPTAVVSESQQFTAEIAKVQTTEDGYTITLRITPDAKASGLIDGTLRLHSNRQSAPLRVIATVR